MLDYEDFLDFEEDELGAYDAHQQEKRRHSRRRKLNERIKLPLKRGRATWCLHRGWWTKSERVNSVRHERHACSALSREEHDQYRCHPHREVKMAIQEAEDIAYEEYMYDLYIELLNVAAELSTQAECEAAWKWYDACMREHDHYAEHEDNENDTDTDDMSYGLIYDLIEDQMWDMSKDDLTKVLNFVRGLSAARCEA